MIIDVLFASNHELDKMVVAVVFYIFSSSFRISHTSYGTCSQGNVTAFMQKKKKKMENIKIQRSKGIQYYPCSKI